MKTLTALAAALTLFAFAAVAFAGNINCPHLPKDCVAAPQSYTSSLSLGEMLP
jgi:hypothetical protein